MFTLPENIICGYCNCTEFGSLTVSPERVATKYEIELYLEDGRSTFSDGVEYKIKKNFIRITRPGQRRYSLLPFRTAYIKFHRCHQNFHTLFPILYLFFGIFRTFLRRWIEHRFSKLCHFCIVTDII